MLIIILRMIIRFRQLIDVITSELGLPQKLKIIKVLASAKTFIIMVGPPGRAFSFSIFLDFFKSYYLLNNYLSNLYLNCVRRLNWPPQSEANWPPVLLAKIYQFMYV